MIRKTLIVHIVTRLYLGGAQRVCLDIMKHMGMHEYCDVLLITGRDELMNADFLSNNIDIHTIAELDRPVHPINDAIAFFKIRNVLIGETRKYEDIIVHTHTSKAGLIGRLAAYSAGIKHIVHTAHGWSFYMEQGMVMRNLYALSERLIAPFTSVIVAVSYSVMKLGLRMKVGRKSQYRVIYNGLITERSVLSRDSIITKMKLPQCRHYIVQVSCLKEQKDPMSFVHIAEHMQDRDDFHFILAGDGYLGKTLKEYIKHNNIDNISMLGWYSNTEELYSIASIITLTSRFEGMPLVILEAMNFKLPIILSDIDVHRELLNESYICKRTDYQCYREKIIRYAGKQVHYSKYSQNTMLSNYDKLYRSLQIAKNCNLQ